MVKKKQLKDYISSKTATNFQRVIEEIFTIVYKNDFLPAKQYGGDGGVDARLIKSDLIKYYAIGGYSSSAEIEKKIKDDALKIKTNLICNGEWGFDSDKSNEFCFIVQTFDQPIPNRVQGRKASFQNELKEILSDENQNYNFQIINGAMLIDSFTDVEIDLIYNTIYNISNLFNSLNEFVNNSQYFPSEKYIRVSSEEKIVDNKMELSKEFIEEKILEIEFISALIRWQKEYENKIIFEQFRRYLIEKYTELSKIYLDKNILLQKLIKYIYQNTSLTKENAEKLIIYIFDKCDIF